MDNSLISIMMPAYNAEAFIGQAIESVFTQTYSKWELLIVNDGSTDNTLEIAYSFHDPRIKVINQPNGGESVARNAALDQLKGGFLAFLDADDLYLPNHLEVSINYLNQYSFLDGVYTDGYYIDDQKHVIQSLKSWRRGPFEGDIFEEIIRAPDVFGPPISVVLKVDAINKYGLRFDPDIIIGPDWDFFIRYSANSRFGYVDVTTCLYRIHQSNITFRANERRAIDLARCRMKAIKHPRFKECSVDTKTAVFYDLMVNLLNNRSDLQSEVSTWDQFSELPPAQQARLFRLMASKTIISNRNNGLSTQWLRKSIALNPKDVRSKVLILINKIHPKLLRLLLNIRQKLKNKKSTRSPFGYS